MIIKKYIVSDMKEALIRAKYELGSEAIIVSQRQVRSGKWYNIFKKKELEVTVAVEQSPASSEEVVEEELLVKKEVAASPSIKGTNTLNDFEIDPFFTGCSERIREQLANYCRLHEKKSYHLSLEEKKDFLSIVLKDSPFQKDKELAKINVLVGPTGVGKTTTIAKLASYEYLVNKKKVGLITIDTYRIGAVEQLKTYASILGVNLQVVNEPGEMLAKLKLLDDCDVIFIDTLGMSPKDLKKIMEVKRHLQEIKESINTYLVFSLSTDKENLMYIIDKYKSMKYDAFIMTKLDEISNTSNLWHFLENNEYPVQFFCHGQDVPDDIKTATLNNIIDYFEETLSHERPSR